LLNPRTVGTVGDVSFPTVVGTSEQICLSAVVTFHDGSVAMTTYNGVRKLNDVGATENYKYLIIIIIKRQFMRRS